MQITPDGWILTTPVAAPDNMVTLICPEKTHGNDRHPATNTHTEATHSLQCPFITFYLPSRYETLILNVNVSLNMAKLQMINISALHFHIWQHLGNNQSDMQLQHLAIIPSIPVHKVYQHLLDSTMQLTPFNSELSHNTDSLWSVFAHPGIYVSALGFINTCRNWIILLLFLLVPICQISMPTFTIR